MAEVIVALDLPTGREALALVDRLPGLRWAKVGSILFTHPLPGTWVYITLAGVAVSRGVVVGEQGFAILVQQAVEERAVPSLVDLAVP